MFCPRPCFNFSYTSDHLILPSHRITRLYTVILYSPIFIFVGLFYLSKPELSPTVCSILIQFADEMLTLLASILLCLLTFSHYSA